MAATDFFTVEVWTSFGLVRYHVIFGIRLMTRGLHIAGIVPEPKENWMQQIARNLIDASEGFLRGTKFLIHDRSPVFAERFVRSIKVSCLENLILMSESSLRRAASRVSVSR